MSRRIPTLFEREAIGVNGALEAVNVFTYCSRQCRTADAPNVDNAKAESTDLDEYPEGVYCDACGAPLATTSPRALFRLAYAIARTPQERANGDHELLTARELARAIRAEAGDLAELVADAAIEARASFGRPRRSVYRLTEPEGGR